VRVFREGETVWERQKAEVPTRERTSSYFFRWNAQLDRSAEVDVSAPRGK